MNRRQYELERRFGIFAFIIAPAIVGVVLSVILLGIGKPIHALILVLIVAIWELVVGFNKLV